MELELSILNAITKHQRLALDFISNCDCNLFSSPENARIANALISYIKIFKSKPSKKAMLEYCASDTEFCQILEGFYNEIEDYPYDDSDYNFDINKLKHIFSQSRLEVIKDKLNTSEFENISNDISFIQKELGLIKTTNSQKTYEKHSLKEYSKIFRDNFIQKKANPDLGRGILTGYSMFDYIRNGLKPADLIIIAGESGSGKSLLLNNLAIQIWMQKNTINITENFTKGYNVAYFSLEMPYDDCYQRAMSRIADVPAYGIRDAKLSSTDAKLLGAACRFSEKYPYVFDIIDVPRGFSVEQLEIMFNDLKQQYNPDVVFIDYMGLMEGINDQGEDWLQLGNLAGQIHEFSRVYSIPVVTAVQLNRIDPAQRKKYGVGLHRIGRSSMIAHHATAVLQIENKEGEEEVLSQEFIYWLIKNRSGENMKRHSLHKKFSHCALLDSPYNSDTKTTTISHEEDYTANLEEINAYLRDE